MRCKLTDGARNFFYIMERIKEISSSSIQAIMKDVMQRNGFFVHSENILVAMLSDDNKNLQRIAVNKILKVRESIRGKPLSETEILTQDHVSSSSLSSQEVRKFQIPQIDFGAKSYNAMIDLNEGEISEPPVLRSLQHDEIEAFRDHPLLFNNPCHNQTVKRHVKLVTQVSFLFSSFEKRNGSIRQKIRSRQLIKHFDTKQQYH